MERGLRLPLVYNSGGYDSLAELKLLDGVVDIYKACLGSEQRVACSLDQGAW